MNNTYFILRHGQTIYQAEQRGIIYPWPEVSPILLTKEGEKQAKEAAEELGKKNIDLIYSSDASRTRQTAGIVNKEIEVEIILDPRLRDIDLGIHKGHPVEEYWQSFSNQEEKLFKRPPQGESWDDVRKRMVGFLEEIDKKHKDKRILIVSHKGPLWFLEVTIKGLDNEKLFEMKQEGLGTAQFRELKK